jgi:membrane protein implicated in regulation of membrane protease activity
MAQTIRLGIFVLSTCLAGLAFFTLHSFWTWAAPFAIFIAGSVLAEFAFNRLASMSEKQRDLEDRTRNPPT